MTRARPSDLIWTPRGVRFAGRYFPATIGRTGITTNKQEGDGATPAGCHRIVGVFYRPDRVSCPNGWAEPIGPQDLWCDDPGHPLYNLHARAPLTANHEALRRSDPLYDLVMVLDWNWPHAVSGQGSAIFIHQWRRPGYPTEGCLAFGRRDLHWIANRIQPGTRVRF